jgi:RHS repeat-associated protein
MYRVISPGKSIEAVVTLPGTSSWSDPSNLFTTNRTLFSVAFDGTTESSEFPDGTMQLSQNSRVVDGQWLTNTTWRGQPNGSHTAVTNGMKTIERINPTGQTVSRVTSDIATGIVIAREDYGYSDAYSLPASVTTLDGRTVSTGYDCCNVLSTTDKEGVGSSFTYDAIKRLVATKRNGIITSNVLDAAGNVVAILRIGQDASVIALETNSYGPSGRLFAHADAMTNLTIYSYISETNKTTFYANTGTRIESTLADGMKSRITGTATHPVSYEYFPDSGVFYTIEYKLADDGDLVSAEWTSPAIDMAGRQALFYYSDLRAVEFIYNTKGQLTRSVDLDNITNLYAYNSRGELELRGIDMDGSGTLTTNSTDRLTQALVDYVFNGAANVRRTRTVLYATNNTTATVVLTNDVSVDGLRTWSYQYGLTSSTKTEYGSGTRKVTETRPDGATSVAFYQSGWLRWVADNDANGSLLRKTVYEYDPHGRPFLVTDARNGTTTNTFNNADQVQSVSTPSPGADQPSQVTTTYYDNMGQVWRVVLPDASSVTNLYWPSGELKQTSGSRTYPVRYAYDRQGRMTGMTNWSDFALASESRATTWSYHPVRGWLTGKTYPDSTQVGYIYTLAGKLYRRTWARSITTTYGYNAAGDLATITYSDGTTPNIGFGYDRRGRRISVANGAMTTTFALNQAGQVLTESYSGGPLSGLTVTNTFDGLLRRTNVATVGLKTGYSYDAASRMQTVTHGTDSATYNYVANSPLVQDVFFKHNATTQMTTSRQYDRLNRLTQIGSLSSAAVAFTYNYGYNSANQRTNRLEADGSHWDYGYDSLGEVTSGKKKWDASATNFVAGQQFEYTFDDIGNRKQTKAGGDASGNNLRTSVYSANTLNQITNRTVPNQFDVIGSVAASAGVSVNGQTNVLRHGEYFQYLFTTNNSAGAVYPGVTNQAAFTAGTNLVIGNVFLPKDAEVFAYDADGNQTNDGRWALTWDAENRLIAMESRTNAPDASKRKLQFTYDWMGRRISKVVQTWTTNSTWTMTFSNRFLYDGWNLIAELSDANLPLQTFAWGLDLSGTLRRAGGVGGLLIASFNPHNYNDYILENTNWVFSTKNQYFAYDGNGNVMAMMDANAGTASAQYEYGPFGEAIRVTGSLAKLNPIRFSTKYTDDENEAVYYGYRYLVNGRWLSRDPMEEQDVPNLYCFVGNSPSVIIDRSGLERWKDIPDPPGYVNPRKTVPRQFTMEEIEESNAWWEGFWESVSEDLFGETIEMPDGSRREKFMTGTPPDIGFASVGKMSRLLRCCRNTRFKLLEEVTWSSYAGKHTSSRNVPWKKIVEATTTGPAKYRPGINIRQLEEAVWKNGTPVCNGKPWKVAEFSSDIGASGGRASRWVRVEESGGAIHGHPITPEEFYKLLGK